MDIYCPTCGEPWDNDSLHEEAEARAAAPTDLRAFNSGAIGPRLRDVATYKHVAADFRKRGCKALATAFGPQSHCQPAENPHTSAFASAAFDLMGDDMDGAASFMDDARFLGLI